MVNYKFRKETGINRSDIEVLAYGSTEMFFTVYKVLKHYNQTNVQQLRNTVKRLVSLRLLEVVSGGMKGNPQTLMLTAEGKAMLKRYYSLWPDNMLVHEKASY